MEPQLPFTQLTKKVFYRHRHCTNQNHIFNIGKWGPFWMLKYIFLGINYNYSKGPQIVVLSIFVMDGIYRKKRHFLFLCYLFLLLEVEFIIFLDNCQNVVFMFNLVLNGVMHHLVQVPRLEIPQLNPNLLILAHHIFYKVNPITLFYCYDNFQISNPQSTTILPFPDFEKSTPATRHGPIRKHIFK